MDGRLILLFVGLLLLGLAAQGIQAGRVQVFSSASFTPTVERKESPILFWIATSLYGVAGTALTALYAFVMLAN